MPNVKISAAADAGTLLSSDMLPLARSGDTNAYHATMTEIATFTNASVSSGAYNNTGRNLVHNALMAVAQRGTGPFTTVAWCYTADRWSHNGNTDTISITIVNLADTDRAAIGDETARYAWQNVFTGNAAAAAYNDLEQGIEDVRRLGGKTITVSFWAVRTAGTATRIGVNLYQYFGTGGSPSASVWATAVSVTIGTTWARYTATFAVPSTSGKTLGTNNDHATYLCFGFSSGATNNANYGNIGVQSGTIQLWGVQLEVGSVATPLAKRDPADDIATCQRFYQLGATSILGYAGAGSFVGYFCPFPVVMRAIPTVTLTTVVGSDTNISAVTTDLPATWGFRFYLTATATGYASAARNFTASAEL